MNFNHNHTYRYRGLTLEYVAYDKSGKVDLFFLNGRIYHVENESEVTE